MAVLLMILKIIGYILLGVLGLVAGVLAIVVLLSFVRVCIVADYGEEKSVLLRWLFLKLSLYPLPDFLNNKKKSPKKKEEDKSDAEETYQDLPSEEITESEPTKKEESTEEPMGETVPEDAPAESEETKKKPNILKVFYESNGSVEGLVLLLKEIFSYIGSFFGGLLHAFVIDELQVDMTVTKRDAAETAIYYGELCSVVFPILGTFVTKYKVKEYDFNIEPDFLAKKNSAAMHIAFYFRPVKLVWTLILLVLRLVFKVGLKVAVRTLLAMRKESKAEKSNSNKSKEKSGASNE